MLTFELTRDGDAVEIHVDQEGLAAFINQLEKLRSSGGHLHLMTSDWGGDELTSKLQGANNHVINHVKVMLW